MKAIIFDMDGVLLDTEQLAMPCWRQAIEEFGFVFNPLRYQEVIGRTVVDVEQVMSDTYGSNFCFSEVRARRMELGADIYNREIPTKPGARELGELFSESQVAFGVATSTARELAEKKLKSASLTSIFPLLVCGDEIARGKPEPDIFLKAAKCLSVEPRDCLVIEDSRPGVAAAVAAGMKVVMVPDIVPAGEHEQRVAYAIKDSLTQSRELLLEFLNS